MTTAATPLLLRRLSRGQLLAFDAVLAVAAAVLGWFAAIEAPASGWREPAWLSVLAALLLAAPVAVRRLRPVAAASCALAVVLACVAGGVVPDYAGLAPTLILCLVLYTVGTDAPRRRSVQVAVAGVLLAAVVFLAVARQPFEVGLVAWVLGACWTVGRTVRERRAYAARAAAQATELAVGAERLRIARELHDIVAHSMSMIAVRATVADHIADEDPQQMREALRVIASASRDAMGELRRALGALRTESTLVPAPGLDDLTELVVAARSAGVAVELQVRGSDTIPEGVTLTVFRLVQEALTNVVKHAHATECRVVVEITEGAIRLEVTDNGTAARDPEQHPADRLGGQGLIGMRERAALFGGDLTAGPAAAGGWMVATTLRWAA